MSRDIFWSWAGASCVGVSHLKAGESKQDAFRCFVIPEKNFFFGIVCDGAGSAKWGGVGAWITSRLIARRCKDFLSNREITPSEADFWDWIDEVRDILHRLANLRNSHANDFATTVVLVLASKDLVLTGNIGDGASVGYQPDTQTWISLSWPEHGEYVSTTRFITEDPQPKFRFQIRETKISSIIMFSDGLERLALDFVHNVPFERFLSPMASSLDNALEVGEIKHISSALKTYLASEKINSRTDDDKTLIIAALQSNA